MQWDIGLYGLGVLVAMSFIFGAFAQALLWRSTTHWLWLIAAAGFFIGGLLISEGLFGWATEIELQPNIDGLSFDEVLLGAPIFGILTVAATWYVARRGRMHPPLST